MESSIICTLLICIYDIPGGDPCHEVRISDIEQHLEIEILRTRRRRESLFVGLKTQLTPIFWHLTHHQNARETKRKNAGIDTRI